MAVGENDLQVPICLVRRTLGESYLVTAPGRGYRLVGDSSPIASCRYCGKTNFAARIGEWACDQVHTITAKRGYHRVDQRLRSMARFAMNVAIGKTKIRCSARLRGCYIAALVTRTAASASDRVCQRRIAGLVGDRSRAFRGP